MKELPIPENMNASLLNETHDDCEELEEENIPTGLACSHCKSFKQHLLGIQKLKKSFKLTLCCENCGMGSEIDLDCSQTNKSSIKFKSNYIS